MPGAWCLHLGAAAAHPHCSAAVGRELIGNSSKAASPEPAGFFSKGKQELRGRHSTGLVLECARPAGLHPSCSTWKSYWDAEPLSLNRVNISCWAALCAGPGARNIEAVDVCRVDWALPAPSCCDTVRELMVWFSAAGTGMNFMSVP